MQFDRLVSIHKFYNNSIKATFKFLNTESTFFYVLVRLACANVLDTGGLVAAVRVGVE